MKKSNFMNHVKRAVMMAYLLILASKAHSQALTSMPELSPVKLMILFVLDAYGVWKLLQCIKNVLDHLADSSKGDPTAKDRIWGSVLAFIGILMVGVMINVLLLKAGEFGAKPVSSVLSGN
jgi:hypothetical protein